jgi:membrane-bound lytic murein transglycosylase MltF
LIKFNAALNGQVLQGPRVGFKTSREEGKGLGQITRTSKFDNLKEAKKLDKELSNWSWDNDSLYDVKKQSIALTLMDKNLYLTAKKLTPNNEAALHFMLSAYNGGMNGVIQDRKICKGRSDCNPNLWMNNVEKYSFKSKVKLKNYGNSFFDINRKYVRDIWFVKQHMFDYVNSTSH